MTCGIILIVSSLFDVQLFDQAPSHSNHLTVFVTTTSIRYPQWQIKITRNVHVAKSVELAPLTSVLNLTLEVEEQSLVL